MHTRPLDHLTILDLSDYTGAYCSKLYANMGAKVIMVEPLGGFRLRRQGPFYKNKPNIENSLKYKYLATDKASVCCDIETEDGKEILKRLLKTADIVLDSSEPGYMEKLGFSFEKMKEENPGLIWCAITPFGQQGPYQHYKADDLIQMSMGGMLYLAGYPNSSPILTYGEQSYYMASLFASVSIMIAYQAKKRTNEGQFIDVSIQDCVAMGTETAPQFYDIQGKIRKRVGSTREPAYGVYPCKDGYIMFVAGELGSRQGWLNLMSWLQEEEIEGVEELKQPRWDDKNWKKTEEANRIFYDLFTKFTSKYTKYELYVMGQKRKIAVSPVNQAGDLLQDEHLQARGFFQTIASFDNEEVIGPGAPYRLSESPWSIQRYAPKLGEHTSDILCGLDYSEDEICRLFASGVIA